MDKKKFKILMIVDIVLIIGLFALMMVLKGQYNDQAQKTVKEQVDAYLELSNGAVQEQWKAVDQYGMAWRLVYATLTSAKTEADFDAAVKAIEGDKDARFKQLSYMYEAAGIPAQAQNSIYEKAGLADKFLLKSEGGVKEVACGKNCVISFTFAKGKLKSSDYSALANYNMAEHFKLEAPAAYHFE
jgi:hypothetical protein